MTSKIILDVTLKYKKTEDDQLVGFPDADYAGDPDDRHSTSGNVLLMSSGPISWLSKKQTTVTLSIAEAEYVAMSIVTQEIVWIRRLLSDLTATQGQATVLMEDNQGAICIAKNPVSHARTKHIDVRYHYVREAVNDGVINLQYCPTHKITADILTKPLSKKSFETLRSNMGLMKVKYPPPVELSGSVEGSN